MNVTHLCASCMKPIVWLNGEPYSPAELEAVAMRCDRCGGVAHSDCAEEPYEEWPTPYDWLCTRCFGELHLAHTRRAMRCP